MRLGAWLPAPRPGEQPVERLSGASLAHGSLENMPRVELRYGFVPHGEVCPVEGIDTNSSHQAQLVAWTRHGRGFQPHRRVQAEKTCQARLRRRWFEGTRLLAPAMIQATVCVMPNAIETTPAAERTMRPLLKTRRREPSIASCAQCRCHDAWRDTLTEKGQVSGEARQPVAWCEANAPMVKPPPKKCVDVGRRTRCQQKLAPAGLPACLEGEPVLSRDLLREP